MSDETTREAVLLEYGIVGTPAEKPFDDIAHFAASLCECPIALVNIVTPERQWFKAAHGTEASGVDGQDGFCVHAMNEPTGLMVVDDASRDPRFAGRPPPQSFSDIRFYAGAALQSPEGVPLGSLCVMSPDARTGLTPVQDQGLRVMAAQTMGLLESRRRRQTQPAGYQNSASDTFRTIADIIPQILWSASADGQPDFCNSYGHEYTGGSALHFADGLGDLLHPDDVDEVQREWHLAIAQGIPFEAEHRIYFRTGTYRWAQSQARPMRDDQGRISRWIGTTTDIHDARSAIEEKHRSAQELNHRVRNIFAVVAGLVNLSSRAHPEMAPLTEDLHARVIALGRAHDFVREKSSAGHPNNLHGMLRELFLPYNHAEIRVSVDGQDVEIDDQSATPLALVFHELATNALKYGALSTPQGAVTIQTLRTDSHCAIEWRESGGPELESAPETMGFGSKLIDLGAERQLHGHITKEWSPHGFQADIVVPLNSLRR